MWHRLNQRHEKLKVHIDEHRLLCEAATPDRHALAATRWRMAQAGRNRMEFLIGTAFPAAEAACTGIELRRVIALRDATPAYQQRISAYITRWSGEAMIDNWAGYVMESAPFRTVIMARIAEEVDVLRPVLRRMDLIAQSAASPVMSLPR